MYEEKSGDYAKYLDFIILDLVMLQVTLLLVHLIGFSRQWAYGDLAYLHMGVVLCLFDIGSMYFLQSYKNILERDRMEELWAAFVHMTVIVALTIIYDFVVGLGSILSREMMIEIWIGGVILLFTGRQLLKRRVKKRIKNKNDTRQVVLFSNLRVVEETMRAINQNEYRDYYITKIILLEEGEVPEELMGVSVTAYSDETLKYIKTNVVDEVFINLPPEVVIPVEFLEGCYEMGVTVHMSLMRRNNEVGNKVVEDFAGYTVLTSGMKFATPGQIFMKRVVDILGGLAGTLMTGILTLIIGPIIYLKDPGPIFFSQTRVGKNGRQFKIYKFRSMYMDAEDRKEELMAQNEMQGLMFKMEKDPRILPGIGHLIRDWSLDEFPQFFNVLKGDMSLIGTRPPTIDEWKQYENHHCRRLAVKPGVTGMWQVSGRSDITDFEEVVSLDLQYITEWSLGLDIKILLKTILVVFTRTGSR